MTTSVVFYEKPGCLSNERQKALLRAHGYRLTVRNLLLEPWTPARLRAFFGRLPVRDWFNPTAPRIKQGLVQPAALDESDALALMIEDPLLIRRPLIETEQGRGCGFEPGPLLKGLGLELSIEEDLQSCSRPGPDPRCATPGEQVDH